MRTLEAAIGAKYEALDPHTTGLPQPGVRAAAAYVETGATVAPGAPSLGALAAATLAACGGGDTDVSTNNPSIPSDPGTTSNPGNPANNTPPSQPAPTEQEASRFLMQASFGGTYAQVQEVVNKGFEAWLDAELAKPWTTPYGAI